MFLLFSWQFCSDQRNTGVSLPLWLIRIPCYLDRWMEATCPVYWDSDYWNHITGPTDCEMSKATWSSPLRTQMYLSLPNYIYIPDIIYRFLINILYFLHFILCKNIEARKRNMLHSLFQQNTHCILKRKNTHCYFVTNCFCFIGFVVFLLVKKEYPQLLFHFANLQL